MRRIMKILGIITIVALLLGGGAVSYQAVIQTRRKLLPDR